MEYSPGSAPEIEPMAQALTRHLLWRGARPVYVSLWPEGNNMFQRLRVSVLEPEFADRVEGRDWVALGYKAGRAMAINALRQDLRSLYTQDLRGVPLDSCPAVAGVHDLGDFAPHRGPVGGHAGPAGVDPLRGRSDGRARWPAAAPASACRSSSPTSRASCVGLIGGLKGAAEYETALATAYPRRAVCRGRRPSAWGRRRWRTR